MLEITYQKFLSETSKSCLFVATNIVKNSNDLYSGYEISFHGKDNLNFGNDFAGMF